MPHDQCALCSKGATFIWTDHRNRKFFSCQDCGKYEITIGALQKLDREQQDIWRSQIAEMARLVRDDTDHILLIHLDEKHSLQCSKIQRG